MALLPAGDEAGNAAEQLIARAKMLRIELANWSNACDAGAVNAYTFLADFYATRLKPARAVWPTYAAVSGVQAVIRSRIPGFADDAAVTTQLTAAQNAMDTLIAYIDSTVTTSLVVTGGWIAIFTFTNDLFVPRTITNAAALANLKTQLQALRSELTA